MIPQAPGDLWYFPPGFPHSIQAKNTTADGAEFLLIFDSGTFSEDSTFLLTVSVLVLSIMLQINCGAGLVVACSKGSYRQELPDRYIGVRSHPRQRVIHLPLYVIIRRTRELF